MNHIKILKRAWHILVSYRILWVFGIILALTTASWERGMFSGNDGGGGGGGDNGQSFHLPNSDDGYRPDFFDEGFPRPKDFQKEFDFDFPMPEIPAKTANTLIVIGIVLACIAVIVFIIFRVARYVAEVSLIKMVNEYEETGEKHGLRKGFRMGWSRSAWRLFLINLIIDVPMALVALVLFAAAAAPLLLWTTGDTVAGIFGTVSGIGLFFLALFVVIVATVVLGLLKRFFRRVCVLDDLRVGESIRRGYSLVRQNLKDVGLMWLIMVGVSIGYVIVMIPVGLILVLLGLGVGVLVGGGVALAIGSLTRLFLSGAVPWIVGGVVGVPILILLLLVPLAVLGGLRETFQSSTWTLTYRELRALEGLKTDEPEISEITPQDDGAEEI